MEVTGIVTSLQSSSFFGYGLLGSFGFIGIITAILYLINRSTKKEIVKTSAINDYKQKVSEEKIEAINNTQSKIIEVIKDQEYLTEETKDRIESIITKTVTDIKKVEEKPTVKDVNDFIEDNWSNI
jgi:maltodextrin utilization protein YvdJ